MSNEKKPVTTAEKPDFIEMEHNILAFWQEQNCFARLVEKNSNQPPFRFLDGPITANNPMGVHHAWGRSIKDIFLRYKAMNGYSCHYRNGFDTQGLWVEVEVEKELGFKSKKDIENYGMAEFTKQCVERITHFSNTITEQSKRLGQWMDWDHSYFTHTDENITGIWHFLKTCDDNGWIVRSNRPMPWCPRCGTSLSQHEMSGSHEEITHTSVFAKLPVIDQGFEILVWTTTPWTLAANVALAVNPELDYVIINHEGDEKPLLLAKTALKHIDGKKQIIRVLKGSELLGLHYDTFFPFLPVQQNLRHGIVGWEEVSADEGSGVVHIAPGCGAEDYDLGRELGLSKICPIDENGIFLDGYDFLSGKTAGEAAPAVFDQLDKQGKLYKTHSYTHSYPVCWRCKTEVLFRLVPEWYIKTDAIKPKLIEAVNQVQWEPEYVGKQMTDWLNNMGDWNISRKRFYGLPLPFYPCASCGEVTVVGSKDELRLLGGEEVDKLPELHRPWIDEIKINCPQCGNKAARVAEVGDVWLDAGITPFSTLGYFTDRNQWVKNFPAEWVTEMREQVRLWFYSLLFMSVTLTGKAPYERVLAYNSVVAEDGTRFSKTGYMIKFDDAAQNLGADTIRYLFAAANPSNDVRFGYKLGDEARRRLLSLWNIYTFFMTYAEIEKPAIYTELPLESSNIVDRWLDSRIKLFVNTAARSYNNYDTVAIIKAFETCADDVSNWYIRVNRRRFWNGEQIAYNCLYRAFKTILQVMAPIIPFMTEHIWQNMIRKYEPGTHISVHLSDFPPVEDVDVSILQDTSLIRKVVAMALKLRNEKQLKVRQPLSALYVVADHKLKSALCGMKNIVLDELNIKRIIYLDDRAELESKHLRLNFQTAGAVLKGDLPFVKNLLERITDDEMQALVMSYQSDGQLILPGYAHCLNASLFTVDATAKENLAITVDGQIVIAIDTLLTPELIREGAYRELLRMCQTFRKESDFRIEQTIKLALSSEDSFMQTVISEFAESLCTETLAASLSNSNRNYRYSKEVIINGCKVTMEME
ncbi:MAG: isoleucine--tRNA ligase [Syntrophomonadaceae bacterium]|nr:isoleucine--tRNA ligase [Syntrophomonadaceae bacterium]